MKKLIMVLCIVAMMVTAVVGMTACGGTKELTGFDIEVAKAVGEKLGVEVEFQLINWNSKETELASKNVDLLWNGLSITPDRLEAMQISTPYLKNKQVAVIRKADKDKYTDEFSLVGKKIVFEGGSAGEDVAKEKYASNSSCTAMNSQMDALMDVNAGSSDVVILDSVLANFYTSSDADFANLMIIPNLVFAEEEYGIAARKGDVGTIDKINTALAELQKDGSLAKIADQFGLTSELCDVTYTSNWDNLTAEEKAGWEYIQGKGKIVIGYTLYAPIAMEKE